MTKDGTDDRRSSLCDGRRGEWPGRKLLDSEAEPPTLTVSGRHGLFAMGAIAGAATYALDKPVLQLEGIVADRRLVEHVRRQDPLEDVLREYQVDYLIVSLGSMRSQVRDARVGLSERAME